MVVDCSNCNSRPQSVEFNTKARGKQVHENWYLRVETVVNVHHECVLPRTIGGRMHWKKKIKCIGTHKCVRPSIGPIVS